MNKRTGTRLTAILISLLVVFAMTPPVGAQYAFAASGNSGTSDGQAAAGGVVTSNSAEEALAAFTSGEVQSADAVYDSDSRILTITLINDINLEAPVKFVKGEADDNVVLDLNGHTITANAGQPGSDEAAAKGGNAIEIVAADYDVEIKGPGAAAGGEGAVCETEDHLKWGADGGIAVCFAGNEDGSYWYPTEDNGRLLHGLRITGGAEITGGAGAEMSGDDWIYNIEKYSGGDRYSNLRCPQFKLAAGTGGAGVGQVDTGIRNGATTLSYARIDIIEGTIRGGAGGKLDLGSPKTPVLTHYSLMNSNAISAYMDAKNWKNTSNYDDYVSGNISFRSGNGGDGVLIGAGRKYVCVESAAEVQGGACGEIDYGRSKTLNCIENEPADAGNGIMVYGDVGLTNIDYVEPQWEYGGKDLEGMGVWISGTVTGGSTPDAHAMHENSGNAGDGITLNGEEEYISSEVDDWGHNILLPFPENKDYACWGIIEVAGKGSVSGGDSGSAVLGSAGAGGSGIREAYTKGDDYTDDSPIGTDHYIVNGFVSGGSGGNELNAKISAGTEGAGGGPGDGISFSNYRKHVRIGGRGIAVGGNYGRGQGEVRTDLPGGEAIRFYPEDREYYENTVVSHLRESKGVGPSKFKVNNAGLSVNAYMSSFKDYPTAATELSCKVNKPSGYKGDVFIQWFATLKLQINEPETGILEPSGTNSACFKLLSNKQYKYLAYPAYKDRPDLGNNYNEGVITADRIKETIMNNNSYAEIVCYVFLEDGRWAKSNTMKFTKEGWKGGPAGYGKGNTLAVKGRTVKLKARTLKKKSRTLKVSKVIKFVKKGQGKRTYKLTGVSKSKYRKYFKVNKKTGKLTVKKGLKKGTYKVKIKVTAAGDKKHPKASRTATCKIKVR